MRITDIRATVVSVPFKKPRLWALGCHQGVTRTVVEIVTDEDIVGLGETLGASPKQIIDKNIKILLGEDPSNIVRIISKALWRGGWGGVNIPNPRPLSAIEMALWDIKGKEVGKPVCDLLGGMFRQEVEFLACMMLTNWTDNQDELIDDAVSDAKETINDYGYETIQQYVGVFPPEVECHIVDSIREELGHNLRIAIDANGSWSAETAIRTLKKMEKCELYYAEDATSGLEALARVRKTVNMVFSTNVANVIEVAKLKAADVIAGDLHDSGGFLGTKKLLAQCELFNLGFWLHSGNELGISLSALVHFIASSPYIIHPSQCTYHWLSDDIIKNKWKFNYGKIKVPREPGLGVTIDVQKLEKYSEFYCEREYTMFDFDPKRPDWFPRIPAW